MIKCKNVLCDSFYKCTNCYIFFSDKNKLKDCELRKAFDKIKRQLTKNRKTTFIEVIKDVAMRLHIIKSEIEKLEAEVK